MDGSDGTLFAVSAPGLRTAALVNMTKNRHHCSLPACSHLSYPCEHFYAADLFMWNGAYAGQFELPTMHRKRAGSEIIADEDEDDDMEVDEGADDFVEGDEEEVADSDSD